ncbi:MAG: hypothetical protein MUF81_01705 [Verrucomicrobia bacterium]|jgi:hypothetical protein|nr:hypothetical protein [Verrucomicrobiota bacterium]
MVAIKLVDLTDECQGRRVRTLMKKRALLPGRLSRGSRQWVARVLVPGAWLNWSQRRGRQAWRKTTVSAAHAKPFTTRVHNLIPPQNARSKSFPSTIPTIFTPPIHPPAKSTSDRNFVGQHHTTQQPIDTGGELR